VTSYTLLVDGQPLAAEAMQFLQQVEAEEHLRMADMLRLTFSISVREDGSGWRVLDDGLFAPLTNLRLLITVGNADAVPVIDAYVIETQTDFSNNPTESLLHVLAMDGTILMNLEDKARAWPGMSDGDIASTLFDEYGFTPEVETTDVTYEEDDTLVVQRGTDIQFLRLLAQRQGFEVYLEVDPGSDSLTGHFHPLRLDQEPQGVLTVAMGQSSNLNRLQVRWDMLRPTQAQVDNLDAGSGENQSGAASDTDWPLLGREGVFDAGTPRLTRLLPEGVVLDAELLPLAQGLSNRSALAIIAEGELNSEAYGAVLRAKRTVLVRGAGEQYSGAYLVERVLHLFAEGEYTQSFTLRRNATGPQTQDDFTAEE
jgi:phage protein D